MRLIDKILILMVSAVLYLTPFTSFGQFTVYDPGNFAQSIINSANEITQTSSTVAGVMKNFQEIEKVYLQGKAHYDKLLRVNNLVRDARKVQQTVLLVGNVSTMYVENFGKMLKDPNFTSAELVAIASGYVMLLNQSLELLSELKQIINPSSLSLTDKARLDIIDRLYKEVKAYHSLVDYYTKKTISVSILRSKKRNEVQSILDLYGSSQDKYW